VAASPALLGLLLGAALLGQREAHLVGGRDVERVADRGVFGPAAVVVGDQLAVAEHLHSCR